MFEDCSTSGDCGADGTSSDPSPCEATDAASSNISVCEKGSMWWVADTPTCESTESAEWLLHTSVWFKIFSDISITPVDVVLLECVLV